METNAPLMDDARDFAIAEPVVIEAQARRSEESNDAWADDIIPHEAVNHDTRLSLKSALGRESGVVEAPRPVPPSGGARRQQVSGGSVPPLPSGGTYVRSPSPPRRLMRVAQSLNCSTASTARSRLHAALDNSSAPALKTAKTVKLAVSLAPSQAAAGPAAPPPAKQLNGHSATGRAAPIAAAAPPQGGTANSAANSAAAEAEAEAEAEAAAAGLPRVVLQAQPINRQVPAAPRAGRRAIAMNDAVWAREREARGGLSPSPLQSEAAAAGLELVPQLKLALADHYLAALMKGSPSEAERIVAAFVKSTEARAEIMRYLRATYAQPQQPKKKRKKQQQKQQKQQEEQEEQQDQEEEQQEQKKKRSQEASASRRRHPTSTIRSLEVRRHKEVKSGPCPPPSRHVRHFIKAYTREVSLVFLEEACALCAARRDRAMADQPPEIHARCIGLPDDVLQMLCEQTVAQLMQRMLLWTEKDTSRVQSSVARSVLVHIPPYRWSITPSRAQTRTPSSPLAPEKREVSEEVVEEDTEEEDKEVEEEEEEEEEEEQA